VAPGAIAAGPGGVFTVTMAVLGMQWTTTYSQVGILLSDGTKFATYGIYRSTANYPSLGCFNQYFSNSTTRAGATGGGDGSYTRYPAIFWLRWRFDGTNFNFEFSYDGSQWTSTLAAGTIAGPAGGGAYLSPTEWGFVMANDGGVPAGTNHGILVSITQTPTNG
jgi:hypothetical protein